MKIFSNKNFKKGFTLTETLVAASIFTLSLLALFANISKGVSDANLVNNRIVSAYLAQEGVEYMRNLRDTYILYDSGGAQAGWTNFNNRLSSASCTTASGCYFDDQNVSYIDTSQAILDIFLTPCGASCPTLLYNSNSGRYNYVSGGSVTNFIRQVTVSQPNSNETIISVTVSWTYKTVSDNITLTEKLYKWVQ